jgi:hypothetical protein
VAKYRAMPDEYRPEGYRMDADMMLDPKHRERWGWQPGVTSILWEWMAGSGRLSKIAKYRQLRHRTPLDLRWGIHLGRLRDHVVALFILLCYGTEMLHAAPNCAPWGKNSRGLPPDEKRAKNRPKVSH